MLQRQVRLSGCPEGQAPPWVAAAEQMPPPAIAVGDVVECEKFPDAWCASIACSVFCSAACSGCCSLFCLSPLPPSVAPTLSAALSPALSRARSLPLSLAACLLCSRLALGGAQMLLRAWDCRGAVANVSHGHIVSPAHDSHRYTAQVKQTRTTDNKVLVHYDGWSSRCAAARACLPAGMRCAHVR